LVLGIIAIVGCLIPVVNIFSGFLATLALIFGIIGLVQSNKRNAGKGMSIAGIVLAGLSILGVVLSGMLFTHAVDSAVKAGDKASAVQPLSGKMNTDAKDGSFTFVVNSSECGLKTSGGLLATEPQGQFWKINIKVTNHGDTAGMFDASQVKGVIGQTEYDADVSASISANAKADAFLTNINPGNSITANVMIDIPADKTLDGVELHDSVFSGGVGVAVQLASLQNGPASHRSGVEPAPLSGADPTSEGPAPRRAHDRITNPSGPVPVRGHGLCDFLSVRDPVRGLQFRGHRAALAE